MRKNLFLFVLCVVLFVCVSGLAEAYQHFTATPTPNGYLSGTVTDSDTQQGLAGVTVTIDGRTQNTDQNGNYSFDLRPGSYSVSFEKAEYFPDSQSFEITHSQTTQLNTTLRHEPTTARISGRVYDSVSLESISGVTVVCNSLSTTTTDDGNYSLDLPAGMNTLVFSKDGYITNNVDIVVVVGSDTTKDCALSKELSSNEYRVVLTWGAAPTDLDSHLKGTCSLGSNYHVYFHDKTPRYANGEAQLDVDDTTSYGPETTTFTAASGKSYVFYIYDYAPGGAPMSRSGAKVEVYRGDTQLAVIDVPSGGNERYWEVFRIDSNNFSIINKLRTSEISLITR